MQYICKCIGGSHSYGLNTPESDLDERGVFLNTNTNYILKLDNEAHLTKVGDEEDSQYFELRRFVELLRKGNTTCLEILFNSKITEADPKFKAHFLSSPKSFLDSKKLFSCLRGYAQGEHRLALGLRPGKIGAKRAEQVRKYGFSPKNCTQLIRLLLVGIYFFNEDRFIVDCHEMSTDDFNLLMMLKTEPDSYKVDWVTRLYQDYDKALEKAFEKRHIDYKFNEERAASATLDLYYPYLKEKYELINS